MPEIAANHWPTTLFGNAEPEVVRRRSAHVTTWCIRPVVEPWQGLGKELTRPWLQRFDEGHPVIGVWNNASKIIYGPCRKAHTGSQRVEKLGRKAAVLLAEQIQSGRLSRSWESGVEKDITATPVAAGERCRDRWKQRASTAVSNEDRRRRWLAAEICAVD